MNDLKQFLAERAEDVQFDPAVPAVLRRRVQRRRAAFVALVGVVVVSVLAGSSMLVRSRIREPEPMPPAHERGEGVGAPSSFEGFRNLDPGVYAADRSKAPFTFEVGEQWRTFDYSSEFLGIERGQQLQGSIHFYLVSSVLGPRPPFDQRRAPSDLLSWLQDHPFLEVSSIRPYPGAGVPGYEVQLKATKGFEVEDCYAPCVPLARPQGSPGPLWVFPDPTTIWVFEVEGRTVVVSYDVAADPFPGAARRLLETVRFEK